MRLYLQREDLTGRRRIRILCALRAVHTKYPFMPIEPWSMSITSYGVRGKSGLSHQCHETVDRRARSLMLFWVWILRKKTDQSQLRASFPTPVVAEVSAKKIRPRQLRHVGSLWRAKVYCTYSGYRRRHSSHPSHSSHLRLLISMGKKKRVDQKLRFEIGNDRLVLLCRSHLIPSH